MDWIWAHRRGRKNEIENWVGQAGPDTGQLQRVGVEDGTGPVAGSWPGPVLKTTVLIV